MKKIRIITMKFFLLALIFFLVNGCGDNFLEVVPKGSLIARKTADYDLLLSNLTLINTSSEAQVAMGDEVVGLEPYFSGATLRAQRLFRWDDTVYEDEQNAPELNVPIQNLYLYNKVIQEVMGSTEGSDAKKRSLRAEALAGRAWTYFLLINYYGKPYHAATAASDPGFPLILESDITATDFRRATVQAVYDQIVEDLTTAIPDLPVTLWHRMRMSRAAAEAILAKVYMFMGKFDKASPLMDQALAGASNTIIPLHLLNYNVTFAPGGSSLPIGSSGPASPTVPNHPEVMYAKQAVNAHSMSSSALVVTPQTFALFAATDLRRNFYVDRPSGGSQFPAGFMRRRGPIAAFYGVQYNELHLLRAECRARLNDLTGAVADLEFFRKHRMPEADAVVPAAVATQKLPLLQFIMEERIREFAVLGYRWFDMRRLSVDPLFGQTSFTHTLYDALGNEQFTYTLRPERFALRFPALVTNANPNLENNP